MSMNGKLDRFWLWELTRPAFEDWLQNEPAPVIIIGIGSIEQHGPHLPLGMDSLASQFFTHEVAKKTNSVALCPTFPGYSPHHMGFKGTVTLSDNTLLAILMDTIGSLADHGVKRFVLSNHHGGNSQVMNLAIQLAKREYRVMVHAPSGPSRTELAKLVEDRQKRYWDVHSGPTETSTALLNFPELVEMWRLKDWRPTLEIDPRLMEYMNPDRGDFEVVSQVRAACGEPDTDDFTSSGVYGINDPRTADVEEARKRFEERVSFFAEFISEWKKIPVPPAYQ